MSNVKIGENEDEKCVVCLEEWRTGEVGKETPYEHKFHEEYIEVVCRYKMSVDEEETNKKMNEERRSFDRDFG